jgi:hypothetical protein
MFGALYRSGLLGIKLPREVGGADLDLVAQFDVIEALARVDGAAAWNVAFMVRLRASSRRICPMPVLRPCVATVERGLRSRGRSHRAAWQLRLTAVFG